MHPITAEYWWHKEDHGNVIRILKDHHGTISVCHDNLEATIFHLTRTELQYNFEPMEEQHDGHPATTEEPV